jgi:hypothetical protein
MHADLTDSVKLSYHNWEPKPDPWRSLGEMGIAPRLLQECDTVSLLGRILIGGNVKLAVDRFELGGERKQSTVAYQLWYLGRTQAFHKVIGGRENLKEASKLQTSL